MTGISVYSAVHYGVLGWLLSGVHWFSDIIGGILLSAGLVLIYHSIADMEAE